MTFPKTSINAANPAPLGLLGFGMTTVLLNMHNANFFGMDGMILAMGVFYGGIAQIIAGIMEWRWEKASIFRVRRQTVSQESVLGDFGGTIRQQQFSAKASN